MLLTPLLLALAPTPGAPPQEPVPPGAIDPREERAAVAWKGLMEKYTASELGYREKAAAFADLFAGIADEYVGTTAGFDAEMQLLGDIWWQDENERHGLAMRRLERMLAAYGASPELWRVAEKKYVFDRAEQDAIFVRIAEVSPHAEVDAAMLFSRAVAERGDPERRDELFDELEEEYGALKWRGMTSYATYVDAYRNPHAKADLAVGKPAPEIEGIGLDGKPMKLSDYAGKVVVLDFWGDW